MADINLNHYIATNFSDFDLEHFNGTQAFNFVYRHIYRNGSLLDPLVWCREHIRDYKILSPSESEDTQCDSVKRASTALEYAFYNIIENDPRKIVNDVANGYYLYMIENFLHVMDHSEAQGPKMYCNNFFPEEQRNTIDQHQPEQGTFPIYEGVPIENTYPINYNPVGQEMYPYHMLNNDQLMTNAPFNSQRNNVAFTENSIGFYQPGFPVNYSGNSGIRQAMNPVYDGVTVENESDENQNNTFPSTELSIGRNEPVNYSAVGQGAYPFYNYTPMANVYSEDQSNIDPSTELTIGSYHQAVQNPEQFPDTDNIPFQFLPSSSNVAPGYRYAYDTDKK